MVTPLDVVAHKLLTLNQRLVAMRPDSILWVLFLALGNLLMGLAIMYVAYRAFESVFRLL